MGSVRWTQCWMGEARAGAAAVTACRRWSMPSSLSTTACVRACDEDGRARMVAEATRWWTWWLISARWWASSRRTSGQ